jgi:hypothetical protein
MAKSVSVAVGDKDTTHDGALLALAEGALSRGIATAPSERASANRRDVNMDISFPSKWCGRRMDIRTTALYLESCLDNLLVAGDLASWTNVHLQLRDSVGISPTSLPRGTLDHIASGGPAPVRQPDGENPGPFSEARGEL